jgi:hypothetical protein
LTITVLVAPSGFKESLSVQDVTDAIANGIQHCLMQLSCAHLLSTVAKERRRFSWRPQAGKSTAAA